MGRVVVVGAGHNGITAAFYLARAGLDVTVIEAKDSIGGACKTEELIPGYKFSTCANVVYCLRPRITDDMRLVDRGLKVLIGPHAQVLEGNRPFVWWPDEDLLADQIKKLAKRDFEAFLEWKTLWRIAIGVIGPFLLSYPPSMKELLQSAARVGATSVISMLMNVTFGDLVHRYFESDELRDVMIPPIDSDYNDLAIYAALVRAMACFSETGDAPLHGYVMGGMGRLTELMWEAAESEGANLRLGEPVSKILTEDRCVRGVQLSSGEKVDADTVVSATDLKSTFEKLLPADAISSRLREIVSEIPSNIGYYKFHCALSGLPKFYADSSSVDLTLGGVALVDSRSHLERTLNNGRNGVFTSRPAMEQMIPSVWDQSLAPPGHHTASYFVFGAPVVAANVESEISRSEISEAIVSSVEQYSPNFREILGEYVLFTPVDLEQRVLLTAGNIHHIDFKSNMMLSRRPCRELAHYRAPVGGMYLCGAGQHPGGEVTGAPGHNAAHAVLEDKGLIKATDWQQCEKESPDATVFQTSPSLL